MQVKSKMKRQFISIVDIWVCCSSSSGLLSFDQSSGNLVKTPVAYFTGMRWECTGKMHFSEEPTSLAPPKIELINKLVQCTLRRLNGVYRTLWANTKPKFVCLFCDSSGTCLNRVYVNIQFYPKFYCETMNWCFFFSFSR